MYFYIITENIMVNLQMKRLLITNYGKSKINPDCTLIVQ